MPYVHFASPWISKPSSRCSRLLDYPIVLFLFCDKTVEADHALNRIPGKVPTPNLCSTTPIISPSRLSMLSSTFFKKRRKNFAPMPNSDAGDLSSSKLNSPARTGNPLISHSSIFSPYLHPHPYTQSELKNHSYQIRALIFIFPFSSFLFFFSLSQQKGKPDPDNAVH